MDFEKVTSVYGRPFLKDLETSPEKALKALRNEIAYRINKKLQASNLSDRAKKAFAKSIRVRVGPSSIIIETRHHALNTIIEGQKKGQMKWLLKAKVPIPIITDTGELIFRNATPRSMANGKWIHPGREPSDFIELAKREAKEVVRKRIVEELKKVVAAEFKKRK